MLVVAALEIETTGDGMEERGPRVVALEFLFLLGRLAVVGGR